MVLKIDHNGKPITVDLKNPGRILLGGREIVCDWTRLPGGGYSIILDGRVYDLSIDLDTGSCRVTDRLGTRHLRVDDPRALAARQPTDDGRSGLQRVCAEMPGKVIRLLVQPGDTVGLDQGLLVLEAMKMQNEIRAPKGGVIRDIGVQPGQAVGTGDFLVSLE